MITMKKMKKRAGMFPGLRGQVTGVPLGVLLDMVWQVERVLGVAMTLRVNPEDLTASGVAVTGHGESMATEHATADGRIDSAQSGWQGLSSAALATKSAAWLQTTADLLAQMSNHAQGLHDGAQTYVQGEEHSSAQMRHVAAQGGAAAAQAARRS